MNKRQSGTIASYAYTVAQMVVALVYVPLLLGGIGQAEYGLYQFTGSIMAYLTVVNATLSAGVSRFYCKYMAEGDEEGMANTLALATRAVRIISVASVGVVAVLMVVLRVVYASSFSAWELDESCLLLGVLAVNLMVSLSNTISVAVLTAHEEFVFYKLSCLVVLVAQPVAVAVCMQWFPNALCVCSVQLALNLALRMVQHAYAKRRLGMDTRLRHEDAELQRSILRFSGAIVLGVVADEIFWRTDQLILGYLYGTSTVAVYAVGSQICMTYMPLGTAVSSVFLPKISRIVAAPGYEQALSELFAKVGRIALYPLLLVLGGFVVFGQDFIRLWAGEGFGEAWWVAVVIMVPFTVDIMQNIGLVMLQVLDKYYFRARMYFVAAVLNVALTCVLAWQFGCVGAAVATGVSMAVTSGLVMNVYYKRAIGLDIGLFWREALKFALPAAVLCAAGGAAWLAVHAFVEVGWAVLVAGILAYTAVYAAVALGLAANDYERALARKLLARLRRGRGAE